MANWARANPAKVNWLMLTNPTPNCERVSTPQANCPMAITPFAGTGTRLGRYLKDTCRMGSPRSVACDLYSNPHPSHISLAGYGTPQLGQRGACSETVCPHSLQGFTEPSVLWFVTSSGKRGNPNYSESAAAWITGEGWCWLKRVAGRVPHMSRFSRGGAQPSFTTLNGLLYDHPVIFSALPVIRQ